MGTGMLVKLAVGICIIGAVSAQYPYNSIYQGQDKEHGRQRPQLAPSSTTESSNDPKFAKIMKQINKVNDDGSYTFGYEADDGSFRVETRTKDGLVKGKYGFVDASGKLKVTEYTAGEKSDEPERTESEEEEGEVPRPRPQNTQRPLPLSARPQPYSARPYQQSLASRHYATSTEATSPYRISSQGAYDQSPAAQTTANKVSRAPPTSDDDFQESNEEGADGFSRRQSQGQDDGHYFRTSVTPQRAGPSSGGAQRFQPSAGNGISAAGRPLPGPGGPYSAGAPDGLGQQYPSGFGGPGGQYFGGPGGPQGFAAQSPQFGGPGQSGPSGQFGGPGQSGPSGQFGQSPSPQFAGSPQDYNGIGFQGGPPQGGPPQGFPSGFRRLQAAPQDFSSIGSPQLQGAPQNQRPAVQNFGNFNPAGFGSFNPRQGSNPGKGGDGGSPNDERYVPSVELDGYSEDLDEDGYPDEPPKDGKLSTKASSSGGSSPPSYRPVALGPQGVPVQGGGSQRGVQPGRGQPGTQLSDEQFQQLFNRGAGGPQGNPQSQSPQGQVILQLGPQGQIQGGPGQSAGAGRFPIQQQQGGFGGQQGGLPPQYIGQQQFGGFPQGSPQGFPQGGSPQGFPQGGSPQGFPQGGSPQGFPQGGSPQGFPQGGFSQEYDGQGFDGIQGFPQQFGGSVPQSPSQGGRFSSSGSGGSPVQSEGFPYDFSPFGGAPQGFQGGAQGFPQGAPQQQFQPGGFQQANFPGGAQQQFGGFPGGAPQGFPVGGGRFPGGGGGGAGAPQQQIPQSFSSGAQFPGSGGLGQAGPSPGSPSSSSPAETKKA